MYCAHCENRVDPAEAHVYTKGEHKRPRDRNSMDEYAFHPECWREVSDGWIQPA